MAEARPLQQSWGATVLALFALAASSGAVGPEKLTEMARLYKQICLKTFPDDVAVATMMTAQHAKEFTPEEVKITMRDDPARGWELADGRASVWLEFPPYHACSVRWNSPEIGDLSGYRAIVTKYELSKGGFSAIDPYDADIDDIHVHAVGEQRDTQDGGKESLFIYDQHITDPKRRAAGETGVVLRFVHQYYLPGSN